MQAPLRKLVCYKSKMLEFVNGTIHPMGSAEVRPWQKLVDLFANSILNLDIK